MHFNNKNRLKWGSLKFSIIAILAVTMFIAGCGGGAGGSGGGTGGPSAAQVQSVVTSPTFCTGGNVATSVAGESYFTYPVNMRWSYLGNYQDSNTAPTTYSNVVSSMVTWLHQGKNLTLVHGTNPINGGAMDAQYFTDFNAAQEWTSEVNLSTNVPIDQFLFPLMVGKRCQQSIANVNFGDVDGDGIPDMGEMQIDTTLQAFENISVPASTYLNAAKTHTIITISLISSLTKQIVKETDTYTEWRAQNVGLVKQVYHAVANFTNGLTFVVDSTEVLESRYLELPYAANDLVYDPVSAKLYASIDGNAPINANQVISIDPTTGLIVGTVQLANNPGQMAVSDDGSKLYVAMIGASEVQSIDLPVMTTNQLFLLPNGPLGPVVSEDIDVVPGAPNSVAISKRYTAAGSARHAGVAIYSNGIELPNTTPTTIGSNRITFGGSPSTLYGINNETVEKGFRTMAVSPTGVVVSMMMPNLAQASDEEMSFSNGDIFLPDGNIIAPVTLTNAGSFTFTGLATGVSVIPDISNNRVYFLQNEPNGITSLATFDAATRAPLGSFSVSNWAGYAGALQKTGASGFAFRTHERFVNPINQSQWRVIIVKEGAGL